MTHLPAAESNPAQLHRLNAWLAAKRGDVDTERRELERLLAADPADLTALDRLAQLAEKDGQPARAAELLAQEGRNRSAARSLRETLRAETADSRRGGNGPPGRAARPPVRGPSFSHRGDLGRPRPQGPAARSSAVERSPAKGAVAPTRIASNRPIVDLLFDQRPRTRNRDQESMGNSQKQRRRPRGRRDLRLGPTPTAQRWRPIALAGAGPRHGSVAIGRDHLAVGLGPQRPPGRDGD